MKTQTNQTKTKLSPQGPQWSRHSVARVRRRGEYSTSSNVSIWQIWETRKSCLLSVENGMGVAT
jgi:hypothetical protein